MKIATCATDDQLYLDAFFGRAPYFAVLDTETGVTEFIDNPAAELESGAGVRAAQTMIDLGVEAICIPQLGKNAQDALLAAKIKTYKSEGDDIAQNLAAMAEGRLGELVDAHGGFRWGNQA